MTSKKSMLRAMLVATALVWGPVTAVYAQASYASPQAAAEALNSAIALSDRDGVQTVLGAHFMRYVPEHDVSMEDAYAFLEAWNKAHSIEQTSDTRAELVVGDGWHFPAPLVKSAKGWSFDVKAAQAEINRRRIGRNELGAIETLKQLCAAQARFAQSQGQPASRIVSSADRRDGLYWPAVDGPESPLGPDALVMGADTPVDAALYGYHYRLLSDAAANKGCSFLAWPARQGVDGVHAFVIGGDGVVRERVLGSAGAANQVRSAGAAQDWSAVQAVQ
ncbi:DUF2950 family protein [Variovorax dokdonensis]|uniref:DUF2950 family protein n=1 Tax=Variovorax dokdonensis TaxID=344883 RepID=A0ABT7N8W1_9BURK|nr:DUF2950 family protein [Variovorax dokdonensis]MDM0044361.1 DUF2950 family protein [Variovorax dokdonensis]